MGGIRPLSVFLRESLTCPKIRWKMRRHALSFTAFCSLVHRTISRQRFLAISAPGALLPRRGAQPAFWVLKIQRSLFENFHLKASSCPPSQDVLFGTALLQILIYLFIQHLMSAYSCDSFYVRGIFPNTRILVTCLKRHYCIHSDSVLSLITIRIQVNVTVELITFPFILTRKSSSCRFQQ